MKLITLILFFLLAQLYNIAGSAFIPNDHASQSLLEHNSYVYQNHETEQFSYPPKGVPVLDRYVDDDRNNLRRIPESFNASHLKPITGMSNDQIQSFNMQKSTN